MVIFSQSTLRDNKLEPYEVQVGTKRAVSGVLLKGRQAQLLARSSPPAVGIGSKHVGHAKAVRTPPHIDYIRGISV